MVEEPRRKIKAMRIATRCTTVDEFVAGFQPYCDGSTCFIPTLGMRPIGLETAFAIQLADGTPMLRGLCVVQDAWETADNPFKRPGLRVKFVRLTPDSNEMLLTLRRPLVIVIPPSPDEFETPTSVENVAPTPPPTPPRVEIRTPGSPYILPANPLTALSDESLGAFVDCMLYEEAQDSVAEPDQWGDVTAPDAPLIVPPAPSAPTAIAQILAGVAPVRPDTPPPLPPTPTPPAATPMVPMSPSLPPPLPPPRPLPMARPITIDHENLVSLDEPSPARRWGVIAGIAVATLAVMALVWLVAFRTSSTTQASTPPTPPAPAPIAPPAPAPTPVTPEARVVLPPPATTVTPKPREEPDLPMAGSGPCRISVASTPAGAMVTIDGDVMGPTPIVVAGPCRARKLELAHPRYEKLARVVTPTAAEPLVVELNLQRPTHTLRLTSTPSGATVSINGRRAGTTPTAISVMGFSSVTLTVEKPGYKVATKRIYSQRPDETMAFPLDRK